MKTKHMKDESFRKKSAPGPKPEMLKIDEDWQEAVRKSLKKKRPSKGWPK